MHSVLFLHSPVLFLAWLYGTLHDCKSQKRDFSFSSETLHGFSASELTFSLQLHGCRDCTGFSALLWNFIKRSRGWSFVAQLQTDDLLQRERVGEHPALRSTLPAGTCMQMSLSPLEPKEVRWLAKKFCYSTHLNLNKLKIGDDHQIITAIPVRGMHSRAAPVWWSQCNVQCCTFEQILLSV